MIPCANDPVQSLNRPPTPNLPCPFPLAARSRLTLSKSSRFAFAGGLTAYAKPTKSGPKKGKESESPDDIAKVHDHVMDHRRYLRTHARPRYRPTN